VAQTGCATDRLNTCLFSSVAWSFHSVLGRTPRAQKHPQNSQEYFVNSGLKRWSILVVWLRRRIINLPAWMT
jgi:hypothetical protein